MTQEVLQTGVCVWGFEIPTIIIFQIQRLLGSEQRNNKFNQKWSLKDKERGWVLSIPPPGRKYLHLLGQYPELENLQADHGAQFGLFRTDLMHVGPTLSLHMVLHKRSTICSAGQAMPQYLTTVPFYRLLAGACHSMPRYFLSTVKQCQLRSSSVQISGL